METVMRAWKYLIASSAALLLVGITNAQPVQQPAQPAELVAASPEPLAAISTLPTRIASANVKDASGTIVGAVQRVELAADGTATRVDVALIGRKDHIISLDPSQLTYDAVKNEILARSTVAQMRALPGRS